MKRLFSYLLVVVLVIGLIPTSTVNAASKKKKAKLNYSNLSLVVGKKKQLKLKNYSKLSKTQIKKVKWSTSNKKVATVKATGKYKQNANVVAKKVGRATIKLKYKGKTYKCKVTVKSKSSSKTESTEKKTETTEKVVVTTENKTATTQNVDDSSTEKPEKTTEVNTSQEVTTEKATVENDKDENEEPTTEITTEVPTTEKVTTEKVTTEDNTTEVPTTEITTEVPTTEITTEVPTTEITTEVPTTEITTEVPTTEHVHSYNTKYLVSSATCEEDGIYRYECECGDTKDETIQSTGHKWSSYVTENNATCELDGKKSRHCFNCNEKEYETIPATGHTWSDWSIAIEPTCASNGKESRTCSSCSKVETRMLSSEVEHNEVDGGLMSCHTKCSVCGVTVKNGNYHQYVDKVLSEATCKKEGSLKHSCSCGYSYTESIPISSEHDYNKEHQCSTCGVFNENTAYEVVDVSEEQNGGILCYAYEVQLYDLEASANKGEPVYYTAYDLYIKSYNSESHLANNPDNNRLTWSNYFSKTSIDIREVSDIHIVNTVKAPVDCNHLFASLGSTLLRKDLGSGRVVGLNNLNTIDSTIMYGMFECSTISGSVRINFDTRNVTDMGNMFRQCELISSIYMGQNFNTSKVTDMSSMFDGMISCDIFDVKGFDTSNVTDMSDMFALVGSDSYSTAGVVLDLRNWDTSKVTNMDRMFYCCGMYKGYKITFGDKFVSSALKSANLMFAFLGYNWESNTNSYKDCSLILGAFLKDRENLSETDRFYEDAYLRISDTYTPVSEDIKSFLLKFGTPVYH